jgi:hypothetical protein
MILQSIIDLINAISNVYEIEINTFLMISHFKRCFSWIADCLQR